MTVLLRTFYKEYSFRSRKVGEFECICGNVFIQRMDSGPENSIRNCGCISSKIVKMTHVTHGQSSKRSLAYNTWYNMKNRCLNSNSDVYKWYGGKGIKIDQKWLSFVGFLEDMGARPGVDYCIDRIDPDGDYTLSNCRWILKSENTARAARDRWAK